jgi:ssDNA-binding replication factor A large subunit
MDIKEAVKLAKQNLDRSVVLTILKNKLLGKYYKVKGVSAGRYLIVGEINYFNDVKAISDSIPPIEEREVKP